MTFIEVFVILINKVIITSTSINVAISRDNDVSLTEGFKRTGRGGSMWTWQANMSWRGGDGARLSCVQGRVGSSCQGGTAL